MIDFVLQIITPNMPVEQYIHNRIDAINETIISNIYDRKHARYKVYCGNTKIADFKVECL